MTEEERIREAKRRYPIGTKFRSAYMGDRCEVIDHDFTWVERYKAVQNHRGGWIYSESNGWAEVVEYPKDYIAPSVNILDSFQIW